MLKVVPAGGSQSDCPAMTRIFVKTIRSDAAVGSPKVVQQEPQIMFKATSPRTEIDSPSAVQTDHPIVFQDSPDAFLDSPKAVRLDDGQIIFKPNSPPTEMDSSEPCT